MPFAAASRAVCRTLRPHGRLSRRSEFVATSYRLAAVASTCGLPSCAQPTLTALHTSRATRQLSARAAEAAPVTELFIDPALIDPPFDARSPPLPPISPLIHSWLRPHTPGPLTAAELQQYQQWGYCIKRNVLSDADLLPATLAVERQVDEVARSLHAAGRIRDTCASLDLFHRLTALEQQFPSCSVLLHKLGVLDRGIAQLWEHPALLSIARQVIGPDVAAHPNWSLRSKVHCNDNPHFIWLPATHSLSTRASLASDISPTAVVLPGLLQTPNQEQATVPWHQDSAYLEPDADNTLQMTAWMSAHT